MLNVMMIVGGVIDSPLLASWRVRNGEGFVRGMKSLIMRYNPDARMDDVWRIGSAVALTSLRSEYNSLGSEEDFISVLEGRLGISIVDRSVHVRERIGILRGMIFGYLVDLFERNLKPQPNDYNDVHFIVYVWEPGWRFVTNEGKIKRWAETGQIPVGRIVSVDEARRNGA